MDISHYPAVTLPDTHARRLTSMQNGIDYEISIWLPESYATGQKTYPVVYLLDGNYDFGYATGIGIGLTLCHEVPELIIVGIGNPIANFADYIRHRTRDYTPTPNPEHPGEGGTPQFLAFIETELIPFIDDNYRTDPADRTLSGYNLGGTVVLYALLKRPALFYRYIAGSPNLWFHDRALFQYEMELARGRSSLPAKMAILVGEFDSEYRPNIEAFWTLLRSRNYEGLELKTVVLEGETFASAYASAFVRGLKAVFGYVQAVPD